MDDHQRQKLANDLLAAFEAVQATPFADAKHVDNWRKDRPESFNCSSFVQWIARKCLGWRNEELGLDRAILFYLTDAFPEIGEGQEEPGDICVYSHQSDDAAYHCMVYIGRVGDSTCEEIIGACESEWKLVRRPAEYETPWRLDRMLRIRK